jgi:hypothetical protein
LHIDAIFHTVRRSVGLDRLLAVLRQPLVAAALVLAVALACLWPRVGTPGLWEPQEMAVADEAAARTDGTYQPPPPTPGCEREPAADGARTLTPRLAAWGLERDSSDGGMRSPLVLLGVLGALGTFAVGWRLGGARAGAVAAAVLLSFPLYTLQTRLLMSELPAAVGALHVIYGLCAIADGGRWAGARRGATRLPWRALDLAIAGAAIAGGAHLAFHGGGALLGLLPPLAAFAAAGGFALPALAAGAAWLWRRLDPRTDHRLPRAGGRVDGWGTAAVALATVATAVVASWLGYQVFAWTAPTPGTRELFGQSIVTDECWSTALGGLWRAQDDLRVLYDVSFEQIAFGLFPWAALVPVALAALAGGMVGDDRRRGGVILLGWSVAGWLAVSVFQRKVGFAVYPAVPAAAIAIGLFVDGLWRQRAAADRAPREYPVLGWTLVAFVFTAGAAVLAKDLAVFPERLPSLLTGAEGIKYPAHAELLGVPLTGWVVALAALLSGSLVIDLYLWRPRGGGHWLDGDALRAVVRCGGIAAVMLSLALGVFWAQGWHPAISRNLSSKHIFEVFHDLRRGDDTLGIMGSMGNAPRYYANTPFETINGREELVGFLRRAGRVFAMAPATELCSIHRARAEQLEFYVIDDTNARTLLLSNRLDRGHRDKNPLATAIVREAPAGIEATPIATFDEQIELVGVKLPATVSRGSTFEMTLIYHVKAAVAGSWQVFVHFDRGGLRFNGDHWPIRQRCQTSMWQAGDYIIDRFTVKAGDPGFPRDSFEVWTGFFTGSNPNWRNMPVSSARPGLEDSVNRVKLGTVKLR